MERGEGGAAGVARYLEVVGLHWIVDVWVNGEPGDKHSPEIEEREARARRETEGETGKERQRVSWREMRWQSGMTKMKQRNERKKGWLGSCVNLKKRKGED